MTTARAAAPLRDLLSTGAGRSLCQDADIPRVPLKAAIAQFFSLKASIENWGC